MTGQAHASWRSFWDSIDTTVSSIFVVVVVVVMLELVWLWFSDLSPI